MTARVLALLALVSSSARGDELSGADKQRIVWSTRFAWTRDGLPMVTVRITEGRDEITVAAETPTGATPGVRVLPDGEGGAEVAGGNLWKVRLEGVGEPVKVRWHVIVDRGTPAEPDTLRAAAATWRERGFVPHTFEIGTVFGIRGEVIDGRQIVLAVSPKSDETAARAEARTIAAKFAIETALHPEVIERSRGVVVARDERGVVVKNDGVIWFAPVAKGLLAVEPADKSNGPGGPSERRTYAGQVYVTIDAQGKLAAVNAVPEDKLLAGLLPAEMGAFAPPEALKAQAVAARNELIAKVGTRHFTDPYRLCASVHCQVYAGAGKEDPRTTAAVDATRGEVLVRPDGRLVDSVYSGSCGGHTEDNDRAWGGTPDPALRGHLDAAPEDEKALARFATVTDVPGFLAPLPARPYCTSVRGGSAFRWTTRVPAATVEASGGVGPVSDVAVVTRGVSGRAVHLKIVGERGVKEIHGELEIRRALGMLKSALFTLVVVRDGARLKELVVSGGGHGHGIGMCQTGAMGMAERGRDYKEILRHYYRNAALRKLY
ncbi:MAG: SpoIID/LytB domain-containing protein [Myxococcales bacterium]|nr:SpoIID/LytB domain-containing protein [Myxococcales bacterium]